jgi:hypothetical protein
MNKSLSLNAMLFEKLGGGISFNLTPVFRKNKRVTTAENNNKQQANKTIFLNRLLIKKIKIESI